MAIEIKKVGPEALERYSEIPIHFRVESVLRVDEIDGGIGGLRLVEEPVSEPYVKDYDELDKEGPKRWAKRFDVTNWLFLVAAEGDKTIGGATVAFASPGVEMLEGRDDLAVLWDIRVHPDYRGRGVGTTLFDDAATWIRQQGCKQLKVETQNVNVRACRFYAGRGCHLGSINRYGYSSDPRIAHETMLCWYLDL